MTSNSTDDEIQLYCQIAAQQGARKAVTISKTTTAKGLRQAVSTTTGIPLPKLKVIFRGRIVNDDDEKPCITEYRLEADSVLHCMGPVESAAPPAASASTPAPASVPTPAPAAASTTSVPPLSVSTTTTPVATAAAAAAATSASTASTTTGSSSSDPVINAISGLRTKNAPSVYQTAVETLLKVLTNIESKPMEEKYRKVKRSNAAFSKRLGGVPGGHDAMLAVGFVVITESDGTEFYTLQASAEAWPKLIEAKNKVQQAVNEMKQQQQQQSQSQPQQNPVISGGTSNTNAAAAMNAMNALGGAGGFGGFGGGGFGGMNPNNAAAMMNDPAAQNAMMEMMSNPEALQAALQNPMVQNMMRNDPNVPPHMRQHMEQLANNPQLLSMMAQSMSDPTVRSQMQQAMAMRGATMGGPGGGGGAFGGGGGAMASPPAAASASAGTNNNNSSNNSSTSQQQQGGGSGNEQAQTEEDMIAEAIRRSLEES